MYQPQLPGFIISVITVCQNQEQFPKRWSFLDEGEAQ
jgi:hypothetical protein